MNMKIQAKTFLVFKTCIALVAFLKFTVCSCPTYFYSNFEIVCMMDNNPRIPLYKKINTKLGDCDYVDELDGTTTLYFMDCPFDYKRRFQYPKRTIKLFTSGRENRNTLLRSKVFNFICEVETIVLKGANIKEIETGAFDCLERVHSIDLTFNDIEVLPEGVFRNMNNLTHLGLEFNHLKSLGLLPFANLSQLSRLYLNSNNLTNIDNIFSNNYRLHYLLAQNNNIDSISEDAFVEAKNLIYIDLRNNSLKVIHPLTFAYLTNLERLFLSGNKISSLKDLFLNNSKLSILYLEENSLTEIGDRDFLGLSSLRKLILKSNRISKISGKSIKSLISLEVLILDTNNLTSLYSLDARRGIFFDMKLIFLSLSGNKLKNISNAFHNSSIDTLQLSFNFGLIIENDTFQGLRNLRDLRMIGCNLTTIPKCIFKNTPELRKLYMNINEIRDIDPFTFSFLNLTHLTLRHNNLETFDISVVREIVVLDLSRNNLCKLESNQQVNHGNLDVLDVSSNFLTDFTLKASNLTILNISHNRLSSLNGILSQNILLYELQAHHLNLSEITGDQWEKIINMIILNVSHNKIEEIVISEPSNIYVLPNPVRDFHFENNKVKKIRLPKQIGRRLKSEVGNIEKLYHTDEAILNIHLAGNSLLCQCSAYDIHRYLNEFNDSRHYIRFADTLVCQAPSKLKGRMLKNLQPAEILCDYRDDCINGSQCTHFRDCDDLCNCYFRPYDKVRTIDCGNRSLDELPKDVPQQTNLLFLDHNKVRTLAELNQPLWRHLLEISVEYNEIDLEDFPIPANVTILKLKGNKLRAFPPSIQEHAEKTEEFLVSLSENLWPCECSIMSLKMFLVNHPEKVTDIDNITCSFNNGTIVFLKKTNDLDLCPSRLITYLIIAVFLTILFFGAIVSLYHRNKLCVLAFLYTRCNWFYRLFSCGRESAENKTYDGFLAYGRQDFPAAEAIIQELEVQPPHYRLCVHDRDWLVGEHITTNIMTSVAVSRKTLIIVSASFLNSTWFPLEFEAAFYQALEDRRDRMIVIVKGDLPPLSELPDNVRYFLSTRTYLRWGEPWFFDRLRFAMHHEGPFVMERIPRRRHLAHADGLNENPPQQMFEI